MATQQNISREQLQTEIQELKKSLEQKQQTLNSIHKTEIEALVQKFVDEVHALDFNRVEVKKLVNQKLTRQHKKR